MPDEDIYRIELEGAWSLAEFYELPHVFSQAYAFNYAFSGEDLRDPERFTQAFSAFPWRGGYSAVNFYNVLHTQIPRRSRPQVTSIQYSSPGWIELQLVLSVAKDIAC